MQDHFVISAKPFLISVNINNVYINPSREPDNLEFLIRTKDLFNIKNVYLSASNQNMFDGLAYYDLFSNIFNLSSDNTPFSAVKLQNFIYNDKHIAFALPSIPNVEGYIDVIVENEAGYGSLIKDSLSTVSDAYNIPPYMQNQSISGIKITIL